MGRTVKVLAQTPAPTSDWFWRRQSPYGRGPPAADRRCPECLGWLFRLAISSIKIPRKIEYFVQFVGASPWQWRGAAHAVGARISWLLSTRRPGDGHAPGAIDSGILLHLGRLSQMRCSTCFTGSRACLGGLVYLVLHRRDRGTLGADASRKKGVAYPHVPRSRCQSGMSIGTRWRYSTNRLPKRLIKATSSRLARLT